MLNKIDSIAYKDIFGFFSHSILIYCNLTYTVYMSTTVRWRSSSWFWM